MFRILLCFLVSIPFFVSAQNRAEKKLIQQLKQDIGYLASDELEGRRTGTEGERKAADFLIKRYQSLGIKPFGEDYRHSFEFVYGKEMGPDNSIILNGHRLKIPEDAFPLPFSGNAASSLSADVLPEVFEQGSIWLISLFKDEEEARDAHFDWEKQMFERAREASKQGATAVVFYDGHGARFSPTFQSRSDFESLEIPVIFLGHQAYKQYLLDQPEGARLELTTELNKREFTGTNVAAYIDNGAPYTVVLGAHYDHLGWGEDGSSLHAGKERQIHNGADDNASGTAALLYLANEIKEKKLRNYNYLFLHFSGEELGLLGSKAFVKAMGLDSGKMSYMINMDMIGRLNDSTKALTVGGVGTSPLWGKHIAARHRDFRLNIDSSGVGPSDHTSFYHQGIPVLFFFTGLHSDYHKPSDDAEKVNYYGQVKVMNYILDLIRKMDKEPKPVFTPTKQSQVSKVRFKVTLGIMADYSFHEGGVKVDGVTEDRPAQKAGIQPGDIIIQLGEHKITGMQTYMEALSKSKSGETVDVTVLRNGEPVTMKLTF